MKTTLFAWAHNGFLSFEHGPTIIDPGEFDSVIVAQIIHAVSAHIAADPLEHRKPELCGVIRDVEWRGEPFVWAFHDWFVPYYLFDEHPDGQYVYESSNSEDLGGDVSRHKKSTVFSVLTPDILRKLHAKWWPANEDKKRYDSDRQLVDLVLADKTNDRQLTFRIPVSHLRSLSYSQEGDSILLQNIRFARSARPGDFIELPSESVKGYVLPGLGGLFEILEVFTKLDNENTEDRFMRIRPLPPKQKAMAEAVAAYEAENGMITEQPKKGNANE